MTIDIVPNSTSCTDCWYNSKIMKILVIVALNVMALGSTSYNYSGCKRTRFNGNSSNHTSYNDSETVTETVVITAQYR